MPKKIKDLTSPDPRVNLKRLATYLEKLPADYAHFEMSSFIEASITDKVKTYVVNNGSVASCGTAACAVGHGPAAHMFFNEQELNMLGRGIYYTGEAWSAYAGRVFGAGNGSEAFEWMFGGNWGRDFDPDEDDESLRPDNTVRGAAARIRYYLAHGVPDDFDETCTGDFIKLYERYLVA